MKKVIIGAVAGLLSIGLVVGCGAPASTGPPTNSTNAGNSVISNTTSSNNSISADTSNSTGSNNITSAANTTSGGKTSVNVSSSPTGTASRNESIAYTSTQIKSIETTGSQAGLPAFYIPHKGLGSHLLYVQNVTTKPGKYILVLNYSHFGMQVYVKPMLTGRVAMKTVDLKIAGIGAPVIGTWNAPPTGSGTQPILTFKIRGVYYLIQKPKSLSLSQVQEIANSLQQV